MDDSDPDIIFDSIGTCNYCNYYREVVKDSISSKNLERMILDLKAGGKGKAYDCALGVSGGVDSSYLLHLAVKEWGLRVLAVHVDAGWNSDIAVSNIHKLITKLGLKLHTFVVDWNEMRELQKAFLKAGVPNQDIPQDHAFAAGMFKLTAENKCSFILEGSNLASESVLPRAWGYSASDLTHIKDIFRVFGNGQLKNYPQMGFFKKKIIYPKILGIKILKPLRLINYSPIFAKEFLAKEYGWTDYGGKHFESRFTRFFQSQFLIKKFGWDKRKAHFSSLIIAGLMSRDDALKILEQPPVLKKDEADDLKYVAIKLGLSTDELINVLNAPGQKHEKFKNHQRFERFFRKIKRVLGKF
jgi:N-acetyl sugar amidotransferase